MANRKSQAPASVVVDGETLTIDKVLGVARMNARAELSDDARRKMSSSREVIEGMIKGGSTIYGVNTGVGDLVSSRIPKKDIKAMQMNLLRSHACGVGEPYPDEVTRAMMLIRANSFSKGFSGVRPDLAEQLIAMLNARVHPRIPRQGSVGASGDLTMLAHLGLAMVGEGEADAGDGFESAGTALPKKGLRPIVLEPKEALSIINGTQAMTALGALAVHDSANLADNAQIALALSLEALKGTAAAFDESLSEARPHPGQARVARNLTALLAGSEIAQSHIHCSKVQDAYTLRCAPQVIGASTSAIWYARDVLTVEMNSATDNPLIFPGSGEVVSGGNFHGQPVALAMDFLGLAVHELGSFSERRLARMVDHNLSGLPPFLTRHGGVSSGMMVPQYVAASLVSENKVLVHPASASSIPTSASQEDHNSMGTIAAWKARKIVENVSRIIAIEMMSAVQGLDFIQIPSSPAMEAVRKMLRSEVPRLDRDRPLSKDIETATNMISDGVFVDAVARICDFSRT